MSPIFLPLGCDSVIQFTMIYFRLLVPRAA